TRPLRKLLERAMSWQPSRQNVDDLGTHPVELVRVVLEMLAGVHGLAEPGHVPPVAQDRGPWLVLAGLAAEEQRRVLVHHVEEGNDAEQLLEGRDLLDQ